MSEKGDLLEAFEQYKDRVARAMISGGEGARVRQIVERLSFSDFEAGWQASRACLCVELPHIGDYIDTYTQGENRDAYLADLREAIESTGVKVK